MSGTSSTRWNWRAASSNAVSAGPADWHFGLSHRALQQAEGAVVDLATVADKATFTEPHQYPTGIPFVFVNGVAVVDNGKLTQATPGKVLTPKTDGTRYVKQ